MDESRGKRKDIDHTFQEHKTQVRCNQRNKKRILTCKAVSLKFNTQNILSVEFLVKNKSLIIIK
jgi:hypothetical protein